MSFNPYAIPPLICAALSTVAGVLFYSRNRRSPINRSFLFLCLSSTAWQLFYGINYLFSASPSNLNLILLKTGYTGVVFISANFFAFTNRFLGKGRETWTRLNYAYSLLVATMIWQTDWLVAGTYSYFWGVYPKAGALHPIFLTYFMALTTISDVDLVNEFRSAQEAKRKNQFKYVVLGLSFFSLACLDFIANYGFSFYPFGYIPASVFIVCMTYAGIKHNIMDFHLVIRRGVLYAIFISLIAVLFLGLVYLLEKFLQGVIHYDSFWSSFGAALVIAVIFAPLHSHLQLLLDRVFFKATPDQLHDQNQRLFHELATKEKDAAVATLASGIAHEIRNPLTAIKTFFEKFPEKRNDAEFLGKFENIVGQEITRIDDLVKQLLEFAKPSPLSLTDTDIHDILTSVLSLLGNQIKHSGITVKTTFAAAAPVIRADANKLKQCFLNIILNAIEAMPDGGQLHIETGGTNTGCDEKKNGVLNIAITDTGPGIPKDILPHIFDPFFTGKESGTGLGLSICKSIIEDHGGHITVTAQPNRGTCFTLDLPRRPEGHHA